MSSAALDFFSPSFDAQLALSTPDLQAPLRSAASRDNISRCRDLLPPDHPDFHVERVVTVTATAPPPPSKAALEKIARAEREAKARHAAEQMMDRFSGKLSLACTTSDAEPQACAAATGPLSVLSRFLSEKQRIRVYVRRDRAMRGYCDAFLKAFDKHMNLILSDVDERFCRMEWRSINSLTSCDLLSEHDPDHYLTHLHDSATPCASEPAPAPPNRRVRNGSVLVTVWRSRHVRQMLLRGNSVVIVTTPTR